ncbi:hypothetical protein DPX16_19462 [Anabarilius grahami]|uniref:Uncharacterized protein n=1 Tax=Anabarilius grahami TaxID=495550 RepID=A0A3N0Z148_ANAGA|nr:hypothetical protein DPX16_19462 [Anabarilius grahami]
MSSTDILESGEEPCFRLEHLPGKSPHLAGKASPQVNSRWDAPQVTANGVHDIEDRILRITGYYGYNPGYSSHRICYAVFIAAPPGSTSERLSVGQGLFT